MRSVILVIVATASVIFASLVFIAAIGYDKRLFLNPKAVCRSDRDLISGLPTNDEVRYLLYGEKPQEAQREFDMYDDFLLRHIRTLVSRPAPGRPARISGPPDQSTGNYNGVERLPGDISQSCQSTVVDRLLNGRRNGFFIECGAFDGATLSNSWFFETQHNWTGLLIEGNPKLQPAVIKLNRNAFVLRACLGTVQRPMPARITLNGGVSVLIDTKKNAGHSTAEVVCFPLNAVTAALGIKHVDFMSLDVEGPELEILSTIDWTRLKIDVVMVEYNWRMDVLEAIRRYFNATELYKEAANLKSRKDQWLDVVFQRFDLNTK